MNSDGLPLNISALPARPGVYLFKDARQQVLYVGKAKNLRNRVRNYFHAHSTVDPRKRSMMNDVKDVSYIVTGNELEAFVLEANLIKRYKPRFNIILRDDKNYPYLRVNIRDDWPSVEVVRKVRKDGALYFGPYVPSSALREILTFIRRHFRIRHCRMTFQKPVQPCIQYQIGRCVAPCAGNVTKEEYRRLVEEVVMFLRGEKTELVAQLERKMAELSEQMKYEEAADVRDKIRAIERAMESQKVVAPELGNCDVIGMSREGGEIVFAVLFIRNGVMIGSRNVRVRGGSENADDDVLHAVIIQFYAGEIVPAEEILVPSMPKEVAALEAWLSERLQKRVRIRRPMRGKKRELIDMAMENARYASCKVCDHPPSEILSEIGERLCLGSVPASIGAFDISNISGNEAVGAFVYWEEGGFIRDRYRRLRMKTVTGIDDYAMMEELIRRIVARLGDDMPDLLMIDGGKGHLEAASRAIATERQMLKRIPYIVAIAKQPDRAFLMNADRPVSLDDARPSSLLLKRIRDEAHRVAVGYHRKKRAEEFLRSPLERIHGIGKKRRLELLRAFGSIERMKHASIESIAQLKGFNRRIAEHLLEGLRGQDASSA